MQRWTEVARLAECPPGTAREVVVDEQLVALFNIGGELYAMDGICAHQGGPLGQGQIDAGVVTCPWHGWQYDVATGRQRTSQSICQRRFQVRVRGDTIMVGVPLEPDSDDQRD